MTPPEADDEIKRAVVDAVKTVEVAGGNPIGEQLLEEVTVEDGIVTFTVVFDRLDRLMAERVSDQLRGAGLATPGVSHVRIEAASPGAPQGGLPVTGVDSLIAVGSSKGGVGKTTVTASLARALAEAGLDVGVFDANVHAPDLPALLGAEGPVHQTPGGRPEPIVVDGIQVMSVELIADDGPVAWRGAMVHKVVTDLLGNAAWDDRDVVLVDLPPGIGEAVSTIVKQAPLSGAIFVSTPTEAAIRATERTAALFTASDVPAVGVVENMAGADGPYGIEAGDLTAEVVEDAFTDLDPVPFDPALREPTACAFDSAASDGPDAIAALRDAVTAFCRETADPEPPADAIDLRGLPPAAAHQQAITEFGQPRADPVPMIVRGEPRDLITSVREALERGGQTVSSSMTDLGQTGWLVELDAEPVSSTAGSQPGEAV